MLKSVTHNGENVLLMVFDLDGKKLRETQTGPSGTPDINWRYPPHIRLNEYEGDVLLQTFRGALRFDPQAGECDWMPEDFR